MEMAYGHRVVKDDDDYLRIAETFLHYLQQASRPSLLDVSPICT